MICTVRMISSDDGYGTRLAAEDGYSESFSLQRKQSCAAIAVEALGGDSVAEILQEANGICWTADPNVALVANITELKKELREALEYVTKLDGATDSGVLMRKLGEVVFRLFLATETLPSLSRCQLLVPRSCSSERFAGCTG